MHTEAETSGSTEPSLLWLLNKTTAPQLTTTSEQYVAIQQSMVREPDGSRIVHRAILVGNKLTTAQVGRVDYRMSALHVLVGMQLAPEWPRLESFRNVSDSLHFPMRRNLPQPLDARVL